VITPGVSIFGMDAVSKLVAGCYPGDSYPYPAIEFMHDAAASVNYNFEKIHMLLRVPPARQARFTKKTNDH
jgi:hypothetical protein